MPLFEYKCRKCGKIGEILVSTYDKEVPKCASCASTELEKLISAVNVGCSSGGGCEIGGDCPSAGSCDMAGGGCCGGACNH